jgi:hypothetical protein
MVIDDRDAPIAGASVQVDQVHGSTVATNADGEFLIQALPPNEPLTVSAWAEGYIGGSGVRLTHPSEGTELTLVLERGNCVTVELEGDQPIALSMRPQGRPAGARLLRLTPGDATETCGLLDRDMVDVQVLADGGRVPVRFGLGDTEFSSAHVWAVSPGADLKVVLPDAEPSIVSGHVTVGGQPAMDALVLLTQNVQTKACMRPTVGGALRAVVTDVNGDFELSPVPGAAVELGLYVEDPESGRVWCQTINGGGYHLLTDEGTRD